MDKEVVTELIQDQLNRKNLKAELTSVLNQDQRTKIFGDYYDLEKKLGGKGASAKTAKFIYDAIQV
jgi:lipid-A-disaccharide synthase